MDGSTTLQYLGGGGGGRALSQDGKDGACGGGGAGANVAANRGDGGSATITTGFDGGGGHGSTSYYLSGGGGGGMGGAGVSAASVSIAGDGGAGVAIDLNGQTYLGGAGGGGSSNDPTVSSPGGPVAPSNYHGEGGSVNGVRIGGSLNDQIGGTFVAGSAGPAVANTGSGGSGWHSTQDNVTGASSDGADGIVVISYQAFFDEALSTTGTVTHSVIGGYHYYEFTGDGTITFPDFGASDFASSIDVLAVAGGGGSHDQYSGGGGAGEAVFLEDYPTPLGEISVVVGTGGLQTTGSNGNDTSITDFLNGGRSFLGGGGGLEDVTYGVDGGCGGGAGAYSITNTSGATRVGGGGTGYVGFNGGNSNYTLTSGGTQQYTRAPGGGGGMGGPGGNGDAVYWPYDGWEDNASGDGGAGIDVTMNGRVYSVAAGGGARGAGIPSPYRPDPGVGGSTPSGGIIGGYYDGSAQVDPVANTGSGAGGNGGDGADGIVVFSYPDSLGDPLSVTGTYTLVTTGGFRYYEFTGNGTIKFVELPPVPATRVNIVGIAGGGGGGGGSASGVAGNNNNYGVGGGGAGGETRIESNVPINGDVIYNVTVGSGGSGGIYCSTANNGDNGYGSNGENTTFIGTGSESGTSITWAGGGGGAGVIADGVAAEADPPTPPTGGHQGGAGVDGQDSYLVAYEDGSDGGDGEYYNGSYQGGGGGGGQGGDALNGTRWDGGTGGAGVTLSLYGQSYTGGGGGGGGAASSTTPGVGGSFGGGAGSAHNGTAVSGTDGQGGGGGGGSLGAAPGGDGGDGQLIIAYSDAYRAATVTGSVTETVVNGIRFYTFTGNGTISF